MSEPAALHCPHRPPCPGCPRFGQAIGGPELEQLGALAASAGIALQLGEQGEALGYRVRARLAVRGRVGRPKLGIFELGSHRVVDIPRCLVHHPRINEVAAALRQALRELRLPPYADAPHRGLVRYLQVAVERSSERAQVVLVVNASDREAGSGSHPEQLRRRATGGRGTRLPPLVNYAADGGPDHAQGEQDESQTRDACEPLLARLAELLGPRLHSLFVSPHTARSNAILGPRCEHVLGPEALSESIAGARVFFPPDAFGQANLGLYARIVARISEMVDDGGDVLELYAGTGAIGLALLPRMRRVRFNELSEGSLAGLRLGLQALPAGERARTELHPGPAAAQRELLADAELVIADPPRKGLDPELVSALCARPPSKLIYLSCGLASLLRDAALLRAEGGLQLREMIAYDLFPFTGRLETLARFEPG